MMNTLDIGQIIQYLVERGLETIQHNAERADATIDYVAIFAKDTEEFNALDTVARTMGTKVDKGTAKTGHTYSLKEPLQTSAGLLTLIKVRYPDPARTQRGAPDFKIPNYQEFKKTYIRKSGNFTLMLREAYEMIEIKGVDVLVYIPDNTATERLKSKQG